MPRAALPRVAALALSLPLSLSSHARADDAPSATGPTVGVRTGWAFALGDVETGDALGDTYSGMLPFWLDAGWRLSRRISLGAFFQLGFPFVKSSACQPPLDCSATDLRFGLEGAFHVLPEGPFDPWFGAGAGYEMLHTSLSATGTPATLTDRGFVLDAQGGVDWLATRALGVGPFLAASFGRFMSATTSVGTGDTSSSIAAQSPHVWLFLGVRARYDL